MSNAMPIANVMMASWSFSGSELPPASSETRQATAKPTALERTRKSIGRRPIAS
jgi:hypothetical protein